MWTKLETYRMTRNITIYAVGHVTHITTTDRLLWNVGFLRTKSIKRYRGSTKPSDKITARAFLRYDIDLDLRRPRIIVKATSTWCVTNETLFARTRTRTQRTESLRFFHRTFHWKHAVFRKSFTVSRSFKTPLRDDPERRKFVKWKIRVSYNKPSGRKRSSN